MSKYLPMHPKMMKSIRVGMKVIHNGGNGRQGKLGVITSVGAKIEVMFTGDQKFQEYSKNWFIDNFWMHSTAIYSYRGMFNGSGYWLKYHKFARSHDELAKHSYVNHEQMKHQIDAEMREAKVREQNDKFYEEQKSDDPKDKVGMFLVCDVEGKEVPLIHKTYRIAELAAQKATERDGKERHIMKTVGVVKAKEIVTYDVTTEALL